MPSPSSMHHTAMANPMFHGSHEVPFEAQEHPQDPEERQIAVDPFSLRQLSKLNIDRPLPIPSVSVDHVVPPRFAMASLPCSPEASPRLPAAVRPKGPAAPTRWNAHQGALWGPLAHDHASALARYGTLSLSRSCAGEQLSSTADEFEVILSSSERKASAPQRWGSSVPLIGTAAAEDSSGKTSRNKARHGGESFKCCMYLPGISRRSKPPVQASGTFRTVESDPGPARASTMSLAVSLERFDCDSWSTSSGALALDGEVSSCFDLPLELIRGNDDETDLPVHAAFMFNSDSIRKSVLIKKMAAESRAIK